MSISVSCECGREYKLGDDAEGRRFKCKDCGDVLVAKRRRRREPVEDDEDLDDEDEDFDEPRPSRRRKAARSGSRGGSAGSRSRGGQDRGGRRSRGGELPGNVVVTAQIARWMGLIGGVLMFVLGLVLLLGGVLHVSLLILVLCGGGAIAGGLMAGAGLADNGKTSLERRKMLANTGGGLALGLLGAGIVGFLLTKPPRN